MALFIATWDSSLEIHKRNETSGEHEPYEKYQSEELCANLLLKRI